MNFRKTSHLESEKSWPPLKDKIGKRIKSVEIEGDCCWKLTSKYENEEPEFMNPYDDLSGPRSPEISQIKTITAMNYCQ